MSSFESGDRRLSDINMERFRRRLDQMRRVNFERPAEEAEESDPFIAVKIRPSDEGDMIAAERLLRAVVDKYPDNPDLLFQFADICRTVGKNDRAEEFYFRAIKCDPAYYSAHINLGLLYAEQANYTAAEKCFENAAVINPEKSAAYFNLAKIYAARNMYDKAERYYLNAVNLGNGEAFMCLAEFYGKRSELERADEFLIAAIKKTPDNAELLTAFADIALRVKDYVRAAELLARAANIDPSVIETHLLSVRLNLALNRLDGAEQALRLAGAIDPSDYRLHRWYGNFYTAKGEFVLAERAFLTSIKINGSVPETRADYAQTLRLLGRDGEADQIAPREHKEG